MALVHSRVGVQLQLAYDLIQQGNDRQAIRLLSEVLRVDPRSTDAWWLMALATNRHDPIQARRALSQLLYLRPDDTRGLALLREIDERERLSGMPPGQGFTMMTTIPAPSPAAQAIQVMRRPPPRTLDTVLDPLSEPLVQAAQKSPHRFLLLVFGLPVLLLCMACMLFTASFSPRLTSMIRRFDLHLAPVLAAEPSPLPAPTLTPTPSPQVWRGDIGYHQWRSGSLNDTAHQDTYSFAGEVDDYVVIDVLALDPGFKPLVALYDPTGALIAYNPEVNLPQGSAGRVSLRLPFDGRYMIYIGTYSSAGSYQLMLGKN